MRGAVLDSPSKGKTTETCFAEGAISVCPARLKDRPSHWSFDTLPNKGVVSNKNLTKIEHRARTIAIARTHAARMKRRVSSVHHSKSASERKY